MAAKFTISPAARDVLARSKINGSGTTWKLELPEGQLERKLYDEVNKVLAAAGGAWNRGAKAHIFGRDPREDLGMAVAQGTAVNKQQLFQSFYTPTALVDELIGYADVHPEQFILEPSIGHGAIADGLVRAGVPVKNIVGYDIDPEAVMVAGRKGFHVERLDFLEVPPNAIYDAVVMNPPFTGGQDLAHVQHAYGFLKPGGRLVAITSPSWKGGSMNRAKAFRDWVMDPDKSGQLYDVDEGAFKESGTNVATVIIVLDKPLKPKAEPTRPRSIKDRVRA